MSHVMNTSATNSSHWLMVLLCFLPLAGLAAVFVFNLPISSVLLVALILACPVIHFVIIRTYAARTILTVGDFNC
jgi:hypothetical protein